MKSYTSTTRLTVIVLALCAGTSYTLAQDPNRAVEKDPRSTRTTQSDEQRSTPTYSHASELLKADIVNHNGETVGSVEDFLFDRGSGRVSYALIKSGDILGIGGKTIAVAYPRFNYDHTNKRYVLDMTKEQVRQAAEFVPENWQELRRTQAWADDMDSKYTSKDPARAAEVDPYATAIAAVTEQSVNGKVIDVRREYPTVNGQPSRSEMVIVRVRTDDGKEQNYVFGPSWYVMGHIAAPMRGDTIKATVRPYQVNGSSDNYIVTRAEIDGKPIELRDKKNAQPIWTRPLAERYPNASSDYKQSGRLAYMSDLVGATAVALDEDNGDIQDAIIDTRSGQIALLCFDPNDNLLGVGDTIRCIPWPVASVAPDGKVRFDATKQMLTSAPEMPKDLTTLSYRDNLRSIYTPFEVEPPRMDRVR